MMKINLKTIGKVVEPVVEIAAVGLLALASLKYTCETTVVTSSTSASTGYDEAIKAIMDSDMYSHDKKAAVSALSINGTSEFYKAIVYITNSGMYSHEKLDSIKSLSNK